MEISLDARKTLCKHCGDKAKVVLDYSAGDLVCTTCGLVLEGQLLDEAAEWRTFADEGVDTGDKVNPRERGDKRGSHEMDEEASGTSIVGSSNLAKSLQRVHAMSERSSTGPITAAAKEQKTLKALIAKVRETAGRLALGEGIVNRCVGLFQDLTAKSESKPRLQASWLCALVHIASVQERATRTVRELAEANANAAGKREADFEKQIDKRVKEIHKTLGITQPAAYVEDDELMARFVNRLQLSPQICKPASHISQEAYKYGLVGRQPQTAIVAGAILIVAWLLNVEAKPTFTDVAVIAKVSEPAVRSAYKHIHGGIRRLLPRDFVCRLPLESLPQA